MGTPGWGTAIGAIFGKLMTYVPGRVEKLKNELNNLKKERAALMQGDCDAKKSERKIWIDNRIDTINGLLGNKASD